MRTSNPALNESIFQKSISHVGSGTPTMTVEGTVNKSFLLILLVLFTGVVSWEFATSAWAMPMLWGGIGVGFVVGLITSFKPNWSPFLAPVYALAEGLFLGAISAFFNAAMPGIVVQAVALTVGVFICLLLAYKTGLIKVTQKFRMGVVAATGAIALIYIATMVLGFFGVNVPFIHESGPIGIIFSLGVVVVAALNLVLDFDFIDQGAARNAPKYMEWYAAFGLLVTLVWLYIAILRLLSKLRD